MTLAIRIVSPDGRESWTLAYALGWTAHEQGQDRDRKPHPHARERADVWERDWLAGWDARHRAEYIARQQEETP